MDNPFKDTSTLVLFLLFFVPGFISVQVYSLFIAVGDQDFSKKLPEVVAYSAIHYAVTLWPVFVTHGVAQIVTAYLVVLVLPCAWPPLILWARQRVKWSWVQRMLKPEASPWDRVFSDRANRWVKIRTKDGQCVGGYMGRGSLTSSYPYPQQIYISREYKIDQTTGIFERSPVARTGGVLVDCNEIAYMQFFEVTT